MEHNVTANVFYLLITKSFSVTVCQEGEVVGGGVHGRKGSRGQGELAQRVLYLVYL